MADYARPQPADPLGYRMNAFLRIRCPCGRTAILPIRDFARLHRLAPQLRLYEVIPRLKCRECGAHPEDVDVSRWPNWHTKI